MFYLPHSDNEEVKRISDLIVRWGGLVLNQADARCFQLIPCIEKRAGGFGLEEFFSGPVYSSIWIEESIMAGRVLVKEEFQQTVIDETYSCKQLQMHKRKRYSIIEALQFYSILGAKKIDQVTSSYWTNLYKQNYFPSRSIESMK